MNWTNYLDARKQELENDYSTVSTGVVRPEKLEEIRVRYAVVDELLRLGNHLENGDSQGED